MPPHSTSPLSAAMASLVGGAIAFAGCVSIETPGLRDTSSLSPSAARSTAWKNFEAGNFDAARSAFEQQTKAQPGEAAGHYGLGRVALAQGQRETAVAHLLRAVSLAPETAEQWAYLGTAQLQLERNAEARTSLEKALALDPKQGQALVAMAEYAATIESNRERALDYLQRAKDSGYPAIPPELEPALRRHLN